ncbi:MAG TPA: molybdopterin-dependent oxidoreductase [Terriglobales bacterium]|nr:molybdopterin-dependent oxidoreductase [Terriglobales bacterium]
MKRHLFAAVLIVFSLPALAQQLQLTGLDGKTVTVTSTELKTMPRHSVSVTNPHTKAEEHYEGVLLSDLLAKIGAPMGKALHGPTMLTYVKAGASDNYNVLFAMAEIDPGTHVNEIIVADTMDSKPLDAKQGPLKLIVPGDARPARSVRMLTSISVQQAK